MPAITAIPDLYFVPVGGPYSGSSVLVNDVTTTTSTMSAGMRIPSSNGTVMVHPDGAFTYTPNAGFAGLDSFVYAAWAMDAPNDPNATARAFLIVGNVAQAPPAGGNQAPLIAPMAIQNDIEGRSPSVQVVAVDPDGNNITYAAQQLPAGLAINTTTGLISGKLSYTSAGSYNVTVTVTDTLGASTAINFV